MHRSFVYAAALLDLPVRWLWPQAGGSLCSCPVTGGRSWPRPLFLPRPPAAVYVTSPDYLGLMQPIEELAQVCHRHWGPLLLVGQCPRGLFALSAEAMPSHGFGGGSLL